MANPATLNAHPHTDVKGGIAVVHNGIIENHESLRRYLESTGARFVSQTDTEVIAHLLNHLYEGDMRRALLRAMGMLEGSYALGVICDQEPDAALLRPQRQPAGHRRKGRGRLYRVGYPGAAQPYARRDFPAGSGDWRAGPAGISVYDAYGKTRQHAVFHVDWDLSSAEKGGYAHYMLKEIHEQPTALQSTFTPRAGTPGEYGWLPVTREEARALRKISIVACGTAYHAGVVGKYAIERLARVPVEAEIASEYRYRDPIMGENELFIAVSQSGETADTLAALREAKRRGARVMAICNVVGSTITREAGEENTLYTYAGPEIAVASTKAYITQAELMVMLAVALADLRGQITPERAAQLTEELSLLPAQGRAGAGRGGAAPAPHQHAQPEAACILRGARAGLRPFDGGGAQAQGGQLYFQRGLRGGRAQARPHRAAQGGTAGGGDASPSPPCWKRP